MIALGGPPLAGVVEHVDAVLVVVVVQHLRREPGDARRDRLADRVGDRQELGARRGLHAGQVDRHRGELRRGPVGAALQQRRRQVVHALPHPRGDVDRVGDRVGGVVDLGAGGGLEHALVLGEHRGARRAHVAGGERVGQVVQRAGVHRHRAAAEVLALGAVEERALRRGHVVGEPLADVHAELAARGVDLGAVRRVERGGHAEQRVGVGALIREVIEVGRRQAEVLGGARAAAGEHDRPVGVGLGVVRGVAAVRLAQPALALEDLVVLVDEGGVGPAGALELGPGAEEVALHRGERAGGQRDTSDREHLTAVGRVAEIHVLGALEAHHLLAAGLLHLGRRADHDRGGGLIGVDLVGAAAGPALRQHRDTGRGAALLRDVRQLVGHHAVGVVARAAAEDDVVAVGERRRAHRLVGGGRLAALVDAHATEIDPE